jgi:toxin FitB
VNHLLDTNVISEIFKPRPHPGVVDWMKSADPATLHLSVLTLGELRKGITGMAEGSRKTRLLRFIEEDCEKWFGGRMLTVDRRVADVWGALEARTPRTMPTIDALLAATAIAHGMVLVTRNAQDFDLPGLEVFDPWTQDSWEGKSPPPHAGERRAPFGRVSRKKFEVRSRRRNGKKA